MVLYVDNKTTRIDVVNRVMQKSTLADLHDTIHGTACGMHAMFVEELFIVGCVSWEGSLETLTKQKAN